MTAANDVNDPAPPTDHAPPSDGLHGKRRVEAMTAILIAVAMATLDTAVVNTALPSVAIDIGTDAASAIWIISAYQLAMVATILPLASLGEIVGHRRVYVIGIVLFTCTSLACGWAWSLPTLIAARALQGLGAAAIMSVNGALIRHIYPLAKLGRGVGLNALVVGVAFTIGPTVASTVMAVATWHWLFYINVPIGMIAAVLGWRTLPATDRATHRFDGIAALLCAVTLACLVAALDAAAQADSRLLIIGECALGLACGALLLRRQSGHPAPMLAVDLFRRPTFSLSSATAICSFATQGLAFVSLPFLFQQSLGFSAVATGFLITPWPAVVAFLAPIAGRLSDRYPPAILGGCGLFVLGCGMATMATLPVNHTLPTAFDIGWRMALCGAGFGFFQSPNLRALMGSVPPSRAGGASGIIATSRLLGQTIGAALVALCFHLARDGGAAGGPAGGSEGPILALWLGVVFALTGSVASFLRLLVAGKPGAGRAADAA